MYRELWGDAPQVCQFLPSEINAVQLLTNVAELFGGVGLVVNFSAVELHDHCSYHTKVKSAGSVHGVWGRGFCHPTSVLNKYVLGQRYNSALLLPKVARDISLGLEILPSCWPMKVAQRVVSIGFTSCPVPFLF